MKELTGFTNDMKKWLRIELEQKAEDLRGVLETLGIEARRTSEEANAHRIAGNEEGLGFYRVKLEDLNNRLSDTRRELRAVETELTDRYGTERAKESDTVSMTGLY